MKVTDRLFPHPVLSYFSDDFGRYRFQATPEVTFAQSQVQILCSFALVEPELKTMIAGGFAEYVVHAESPYTRYRIVERTSEDCLLITIDGMDVMDRIELSAFVIARKHIDNFHSSNFHPDFGDQAFSISKGQLLAVSEPYYIDVEDPEELRRPVSSIIRVVENAETDARPMLIDVNDHKIIVRMSEANFERYRSVSTDVASAPALHVAVVVPALMQAISFIRQDADGEHADKRWYRHIERHCLTLGIELTDKEVSEIEIALALLEDPLARSLAYIRERFASEEEE